MIVRAVFYALFLRRGEEFSCRMPTSAQLGKRRPDEMQMILTFQGNSATNERSRDDFTNIKDIDHGVDSVVLMSLTQ